MERELVDEDYDSSDKKYMGGSVEKMQRWYNKIQGYIWPLSPPQWSCMIIIDSRCSSITKKVIVLIPTLEQGGGKSSEGGGGCSEVRVIG